MNPRSSVLDQMNTTADAPTLDISAKNSSFKRQQDSLSEIAHLVENCNNWPAPGSEDTELGVLMELEVGHGETEVYARVQA